ncbi:MAG: tRNA CCA-pyrophosphorylase [Candidatus Lokiarchaeota archaeon]|nr:tRNA CCA-pyrophosphorylase [Candidatus Lokiarchaeota archaeon]
MATISVMKVYKLLPKTNCKECGKSSCMAFAAELAKGDAKVEDCPPIMDPKYDKQRKELEEYLAPVANKGEAHIEIDPEKCDGCGICIVSCPVNPRYASEILSGKSPKYPLEEHQIFQVYDGKAILVKLEHCRRVEGEGRSKNCRICETYCPQDAIKIF